MHMHIIVFFFKYLQTVIKVSEIISIKKDKTAHLFPNAIMISATDKKVL